ncbi:MAG: hypothetical protein AAFX39_05925 [Pseudomonadota bacterium]
MTDQDTQTSKKTWHDDLPFPKRWIGYVAIKFVVLGAALLIALSYYGLI